MSNNFTTAFDARRQPAEMHSAFSGVSFLAHESVALLILLQWQFLTPIKTRMLLYQVLRNLPDLLARGLAFI